MRLTFTDLQTNAHNFTQTQSTDTATNTILKERINAGKKYIHGFLGRYINRLYVSAETVADQQYYAFPQDLSTVESVTITIADVDYPLTVVESQDEWNDINAIEFAVGAIPDRFFPRSEDFGIFPIPQAVHDITLVYTPITKNLTAEDYTTGTIAVTNGDATVTGTGTTFTSAMVGRYIQITATGEWYKIASFTSTTSLELTNVYQGTTSSGLSYRIGDVSDLPAEFDDLLWQYAISQWYGMRKDTALAQFWNNMFYTGDGMNPNRDLGGSIKGGFLALQKKYASRTTSALVNRKPRMDFDTAKLWATTASI